MAAVKSLIEAKTPKLIERFIEKRTRLALDSGAKKSHIFLVLLSAAVWLNLETR